MEAGLIVQCGARGVAENSSLDAWIGSKVVSIREPSHANDAVFVLQLIASNVIASLGRAAGIVWSNFVLAGIEVNLSTTQTAAPVRWCGEGADEEKGYMCNG